jgi:hypothetical protein
MVMKKIFIGGFGGSGSRVIQNLFWYVGYFVGQPLINGAFDYMGPYRNFVAVYDKFYFNGDELGLDVVLQSATMYRKTWSLKHGHLMFSIDLLKEWYPDSQFIYAMRNPVDNMLNSFDTHHKYGGLPLDASLEEKVRYYIKISQNAIAKADYIFKLEDICNSPEKEIKRLLDFAYVPEHKYDIKDLVKTIKSPQSIGCGKEYYDKFDLSEVGY